MTSGDPTAADPRLAQASAAPVQCVASPARASIVSVTTRAAIRGSSFDARGRSCREKPVHPAAAKRSCQRQTQVLDLPVSRMIAFVPAPSALSKTICARQTCFCGAFRSLTTSRSRSSSAAVTENEIPVRMPQTGTPQVRRESLSGFKCQISSTSPSWSLCGIQSALRSRRDFRAQDGGQHRLHPFIHAAAGPLAVEAAKPIDEGGCVSNGLTGRPDAGRSRAILTT